MRNFFPFLSQSLPLCMGVFIILTHTSFIKIITGLKGIHPGSHIHIHPNTLTTCFYVSLWCQFSAPRWTQITVARKNTLCAWRCLALKTHGQKRPQKPVNNHIKASQGAQRCLEPLHISKGICSYCHQFMLLCLPCQSWGWITNSQLIIMTHNWPTSKLSFVNTCEAEPATILLTFTTVIVFTAKKNIQSVLHSWNWCSFHLCSSV